MVKPYPAAAAPRAQARFIPIEEQTDGQLLKRFVHLHDEAAFAALVQRHGPMVLGVCRRILRQEQDAEDAFQATFLVLVRKAGSLERPELLANWLYGVANRTAQQARAKAARRCHHESEAASMSGAISDPEAASQELRELLDEALCSLPELYRAPLVLCYLEGKSNQEAAHHLGWPSGSISARLARGRELLRERLTSRRQALAALAPGLLERPPEPEAVPSRLTATTVEAALALAGATTLSSALLPAKVRALAESTLLSLARKRRHCVHWLWLLLLAVLLVGTIAILVVACGGSVLSGGLWQPTQSVYQQEQPAYQQQPTYQEQRGGCCH
jgi:RNA polymerase sigma factor (sigma-70 family)